MSIRLLFALATLLLAACGNGPRVVPPSNPGATLEATQWQIGPTIKDRNWSVGLPAHPALHAEGGWFVDILPGAHLHAITTRIGPLVGRTLLRARFRIEGEGVLLPWSCKDWGAGFGNPCPAGTPALISLYFQRAGDDWSARGATQPIGYAQPRGGMEAYRWYATFATVTNPTPSEYEIIAPLDGAWTATVSCTRAECPADFNAALLHTDNVGFVFGGGDGYAHGVTATGPVRFVLIEFAVE